MTLSFFITNFLALFTYSKKNLGKTIRESTLPTVVIIKQLLYQWYLYHQPTVDIP